MSSPGAWWGRSPDLRRHLTGVDVLLLASLLWLLAKLLRYAFPPLFDTFRVSFGVTNATLGTAFTAMMLCYAAVQYPAGAAGDRIGHVSVIVGGAVLAAVGAIGIGLGVASAAGVVGIAAAMVLIGIGTGVHKTLSLAVLTAVYDRQGRAVGTLDTFGTLGGVLAPLLVVVVLTAPVLGWELIYLCGGILGIALAIGFATRVPERLHERRSATDRHGAEAVSTGTESDAGALEGLTTPRVLAFVGVTVLFSFSYNGMVAFLPSYAVAETSLTTAEAGLLYAAFFAVSLVQPFSGAAADRWGTLPVIAITLAVAALGMAILIAIQSAAVAVGAVLLVGGGSHGFRPVRGAHLVSLAPAGATGGTVGAARTALMGAGALAPAAVGWIASGFGFRMAFLPLVVSLIAAALGAVVLMIVG